MKMEMTYFDKVMKYGTTGIITVGLGLILYSIAKPVLIVIAIIAFSTIFGTASILILGVIIEAVIRAFKWGLKKWKKR